MMKAAVVEAFDRPLVLREWDVPSPGPGQILVRTEACGVCLTDLHAARGDWPANPMLPFEMATHPHKEDYPVSKVRRYLEPSPVVLLTSRWGGETDVMTLGWQTVMEFTPSLVSCMISRANHNHHLIRGSGECVINLPTKALIDAVIGNTSGADTDKFKAFKLTANDAVAV